MYALIGIIFILVINFYAFREVFSLIRNLWRKFVHFLLDDPD